MSTQAPKGQGEGYQVWRKRKYAALHAIAAKMGWSDADYREWLCKATGA